MAYESRISKCIAAYLTFTGPLGIRSHYLDQTIIVTVCAVCLSLHFWKQWLQLIEDCLTPHRQSYSRQTRTVYQSSVSAETGFHGDFPLILPTSLGTGISEIPVNSLVAGKNFRIGRYFQSRFSMLFTPKFLHWAAVHSKETNGLGSGAALNMYHAFSWKRSPSQIWSSGNNESMVFNFIPVG